MTVYILKFDRPLGNPDNPRGMAHYYIGYTSYERFDERMKEHANGNGAAITRAAAAMGIGWKLVAKLWGGRDLERKLKNLKNTPLLVKRLHKQGKLYHVAQVTERQRAILFHLMDYNCIAPYTSIRKQFDGRALYWLMRRGLVTKRQDGMLELTQSGLVAITGDL